MFGRVRGFFITDSRFNLNKNAATVIAQIACHENALPQGAPTSPILSNLIGHILDIRLVRFAKKNRLTYSRYVDDITFSTNEQTVPTDLAVPIAGGNQWSVGKPFRDLIERAGFKLNDSKTRMQIRGSRQVATGLVVNSKVNVCSEFYRDTRAMCNALFQTGSYHRPGEDLNPINTLAPLEGRLAHVLYVKRRRDLDEQRLTLIEREAMSIKHAGLIICFGDF